MNMDNNIIKVHPLTDTPTEAWIEISKKQQFIPLKIQNPTTPITPDKVRIVCMSDTHSENIKFDIPDGDIFIHAGDFTRCGFRVEIIAFNEWLKSLPHRHKIVICGNHELSFDENCDILDFKEDISAGIKTDLREYLTNCIYLQDAEITLFGIKFYGTPWQPKFREGAFNLLRGEQCLSKWNLIPDDTDVLITHGPPLGRGDLLPNGGRGGCVELLSTIQQRVKPKYHIFGHIHEGYGMSSDGTTVYINASTCNQYYFPKNLPVVFDIPLPEGHGKIV